VSAALFASSLVRLFDNANNASVLDYYLIVTVHQAATSSAQNLIIRWQCVL
jgi:hypothetical protein